MNLRALLVSVAAIITGCNANEGSTHERMFERVAVSHAAQRRSSLDRTQSSYVSTRVRLADKRVLHRGHARLEIAYDPARPVVNLSVEAKDSTETWHARFPLEASDIVSDQSPPRRTRAHIRHSRGGESTSEHILGQISVERTRVAGQRTVMRGRLHDDSDILLAEFQTELEISCAVPPEMLGSELNLVTDASTLGVQVLVYDNDLESSFCSQFQDLL